MPNNAEKPRVDVEDGSDEKQGEPSIIDGYKSRLDKLTSDYQALKKTPVPKSGDEAAAYFDAVVGYLDERRKLRGELMGPDVRAANPGTNEIYESAGLIGMSEEEAEDRLKAWRPDEGDDTIRKSDEDISWLLGKYAEDEMRLSAVGLLLSQSGMERRPTAEDGELKQKIEKLEKIQKTRAAAAAANLR